MPRPAPKRNRTKGLPALTNDATTTEQARDQNPDSTNASKSPGQAAERGSALDPREQLRNQTPMTKSYENAIESSPMGERQGTGSRPATGSRPPTRSRGYSSTLSFAGRKGGDTSSRIPGTPAFESSILSNFRRRPRQQSILQMMQAEDGSSELDDDDFLGGLSPQDESTPLHLARKSLQPRADRSPSESSLPSSGGSRKRKRATRARQVPQSPSENATPVPRHDHESHFSENTPRALQFPETFSQTMAPPASSPAIASAQGRSPVATTQQATETNAKARPHDRAHLTTATLQDRLLARRRARRHKHRAADEFDLPSDESDGGRDAAAEDDDELSYLPPRRARRGEAGKPKPLANASDKSKLNNQNKAKPAKTSKAAAATYSRARGSAGADKENQLLALWSPSSSPLSSPPDSDAYDSDSASEMRPTPRPRYTSAELRAAAKKFAEIDKWRLEFEDVSASETQGD